MIRARYKADGDSYNIICIAEIYYAQHEKKFYLYLDNGIAGTIPFDDFLGLVFVENVMKQALEKGYVDLTSEECGEWEDVED